MAQLRRFGVSLNSAARDAASSAFQRKSLKVVQVSVDRKPEAEGRAFPLH